MKTQKTIDIVFVLVIWMDHLSYFSGADMHSSYPRNRSQAFAPYLPSSDMSEFSKDDVCFLRRIETGRTTSAYLTGDVLYQQSEDASSLFFIHSGHVKLLVTSVLGKDAIVAIPGPNEFFGEACLRVKGTYCSSATVITDALITKISRSSMLAALRENGAIAETFLAHMLRRIARAEDDLIDQLMNPAEKRLARLLLVLAESDSENLKFHLPARLTQGELAEMIGTTRSRVNHFMRKFTRLGYISYKQKIEVNHSLLRALLAEEM